MTQFIEQRHCISQTNSNADLISVPTQSCPCKSFCKDKVSVEEFADLVLLHRKIVIRQPTSKDIDMASFLIDQSFSHGFWPFDFEGKNKMEGLLRNNGTMESEKHIFKLFIMHHTSQKDTNPCAALLVKMPKKKPIKEYDNVLDIDFLAVRNDFQKKYLSTLMVSYAVKIAQSYKLSTIRLWTSPEGIQPYIRFGFASKQVDSKSWKKYSETERVAILESNCIYKLLLLHFERPDVRNAMREQLYRGLIENSEPLKFL